MHFIVLSTTLLTASGERPSASVWKPLSPLWWTSPAGTGGLSHPFGKSFPSFGPWGGGLVFSKARHVHSFQAAAGVRLISPLLGSFSVPFFAWWLFFVLSPPQTGGPSSEHGRRTDDSIAPQAQEPGETILYFPDYVDGGGWSVQLVLSNVDPETAAEVRVDVYDPDGQPVRDLFDSDLTLEIPSLGSRVLRSAGSGALRRGWIEVQTRSAAVSGLLTYRDTQSGIEVGVKPVALGQRFALFVEESPTVGAGVAVYKTDAAARVELRIRNEEGHDPMEGGVVRWGDFRQAARTLPEWFDVPGVDTEFLRDFRGLLFLETEDDSRFAPLGLRFGKGTSSLSAVPAIRTQSQEPQEAALVFPDYVDGGGWSVQLVLSNVDPDAAAEVRVDVYDPDGQPVRNLLDSDLTFEVPSQGSRVLRSAGSGAIRRGWIQVETDAAAVGGLLTYRDARTGIEVGVEPIRLGNEFALFVEESETIGAGLALFNPEASSRIELRLRDEEGNDPLDGVYVPWRDFHQAARTLPEWFDVEGVDTGFLRDFRGLLFLRTEDESGFAPLGLRFGKRSSSLSAVPAIRIPEGGGIDGGQAPPPTVTLSASPPSIDRGQSTTLTWSSTNAESAEITPDIGGVPTSGTRKVSPNVTTTYRITATGADGQTATASATVTVAVSERAALRALFDALGGSGWSHSNNWLTDTPLGDWYGVEVDSQGRVIGLRMAVWVDTEDGGREKLGNGLTGVIPPELGSLPHLRVLDLSHNRLEGPIPAQLGSLSSLQVLDLSGNQLTGPIPPELGSLSNLQRLNLGGNRLTGPIPPELGSLSNLQWLFLSGNQLTGPIPPELGSLSNLQWLFLSGNQLTGPIPPSFLQLEQLGYFYFSDNLGLCAPGTTGFVDWLKGIEQHDGPYCNQSDVAVIESLYQATGGANWTNSDGWLGEGAVSDWYGIRADSLGRVTGLDLSDNGLEGRVPGNLGQLSQMTELRIGGNALSGRLPLILTRLPLHEFHYADTELCAPTEASFQAWLNAIPSHDGTNMDCAPLTDRDILVSLYDATGGPDWTNNENWLTDTSLGDWSGVEVDGRGRVIGLRFSQNGLAGPIPPELGSLSNLQSLSLGGNQLAGPIPPDLGSLSNLQRLDLSENQLTGPIPPDLGSLSNLGSLYLWENQLTGPIPPDLGSLSNLRWLDLGGNQLTGPIPPDLGSLSNLGSLYLWENQLTGPIPPDLGSLSNLGALYLSGNQLTGPIPPDLGSLSNLRTLYLSGNQLTGPIPPDLGSLSNLRALSLDGNQLTGPIPPELGGMEHLRTLSLSRNAEMSGALPARLTDLLRLEALLAGDTRLCVPSDARFQNWLERVWKRRIAPCFRDGLPKAYLTQAVQSREFPVPLVAGEDALLRMFVTAPRAGGHKMPPVRARFYVDGRETHVLDIPGKSTPVPTGVDEGALSASANAEVPGEIVQPGLEMVIEVDPEGILDPGLGVTKRIPEEGRLAVDVQTMPLFDLTLIPFLWSQDPDSSIVDLVEAMAEDAEGHEMLWQTRTLLPIGELEVTAHERVLSTSNNAFDLRANAGAIRAMEGGTGYYMGLMSRPVTGASGVGFIAGWVSFSIPYVATIAHELGHNLSLHHAPCGGAGGPDPSYPQTDGSIGAWGYDLHEGGQLVPPSRPDLMSYCGPYWISDYHFTNALRYRLHTAASGGPSSLVAAPARSLLLWGGVDAGGTPFLEPAFVVEAPASLPRSTGEYEIVGRTADGDELFSLPFQMPEVADGDGSSSFAFVLPVQPEWPESLASITLSGPGGSATLDDKTDRPVTILRNSRTGQIRGILRDGSAAALARDDAVSALSREPDMEALNSRGIPDSEDWTR